MSKSDPLLNGRRSSDAPCLRLRIESGIAPLYRGRQRILSVVLALLALRVLQGKLVREVVYRAADLLRELLSQRTLDGELLGKLPERRNQERGLDLRILREGIELSGPGRHLLPKLVTQPWVTLNLRCQSLRCVL
jgi:hypothetical protein